MYTLDKEGDSQTLKNDENFKSMLKDSVKYNIYRINMYLNINNLHFKPSSKPKIFEGIYKDPFPTSGPTSGFGNRNTGTGPGTKKPAINLPQNVVIAI